MSALARIFRTESLDLVVRDGVNVAKEEDALRARLVRLTGTLTADATVILPHRKGTDWIVENATTHTVTVKGSVGSGTAIEHGQARLVVCTDADLVGTSASGGGSSLVISGEGPPSGPADPGTMYVDTAAAADVSMGTMRPDAALYLRTAGAWMPLRGGPPMIASTESDWAKPYAYAHWIVRVSSLETVRTVQVNAAPSRGGDRVTVIVPEGCRPASVDWLETITKVEPGTSATVIYDEPAETWRVEMQTQPPLVKVGNSLLAAVEPDCSLGGVVDGGQKALDARTIVLTGEPDSSFTFTATGAGVPVASWIVVNATSQTANLDLDGDTVHEGSLDPGDMAVVVLAGGIARMKVLT